MYSDAVLEPIKDKTVVEALLVIHDYQPKLMNHVNTLNKRSVLITAVDKWVFERDIDRGFLGEALAWVLLRPYSPLINGTYLRLQEVKLKKRLVMELLENLVLNFPELSYELRIKPEYFMYEAMLSRARLFPPMIYDMRDLTQASRKGKNVSLMLDGYLKALKKLESDGLIDFSDGTVTMTERFISKARSPRVRLINVSKTVPRALFTSLLRILPRILNAASQNEAILTRLQKIRENSKAAHQIDVPEKYVYVPTATGLVSLANRTGVEAFARQVLSTGEDSKIEIEEIGGILNDVYLVKALVEGTERKVVVKKFRDWSSFKWFPLALWSVGTKTFAVLSYQRLEKECAINRFLHSKGIAVPRLLHVSPEERLVFMEYLEGENANRIIKRIADSKTTTQTRKELKIIERIGKQLAKVHSLGIALGDTKPENIMIGEHSEIYLMDLEQASRNGDKTWDVAEFLYFAGHDIPLLAESRKAESIAQAFITGYLEAGGDVNVVKKAAKPKYTKVFSIFTFPHIMLSISNACRNAG